MADVVYLHVGAPKTGTTYLQDRLLANRPALERRGVAYPVGPFADMFPAALDLIDRPWGGQRETVRGEWDALCSRVRRVSGRAVVSHEILAAATPDQVARVARDLGESELHVVYSARDLARQIPAEWQELVKHQSAQRFRRFLRRIQEAERRDSDLWFWRVQNLPDVLERWGHLTTPDRVHLVVVPHPGAAPDELWRRYCRAFGVDPRWAPANAARVNASLGIDEAQLVRELNRRLRRASIDNAHYRTLVRQVVVHETLAQRERMRRVTVPPHTRPWIEEVTDEWLSWVAGSGIRVVGDLDDLRPVFGAGRWQNPDEPRPARMADAALDALVAVLLEAAERPDPDMSPVARLGRAARRLSGR
jgi:hypothetical protein